VGTGGLPGFQEVFKSNDKRRLDSGGGDGLCPRPTLKEGLTIGMGRHLTTSKARKKGRNHHFFQGDRRGLRVFRVRHDWGVGAIASLTEERGRNAAEIHRANDQEISLTTTQERVSEAVVRGGEMRAETKVNIRRAGEDH